MTNDVFDVLDLKSLRCIWAVAKRGTLVQAGIELGISETAISQRLKSLEKYLGVKLYETRGGKVRFTAAGEKTIELAFGLFDQLEDFERAIVNDEAMGTITLCANDGILRYFLPDIVKQLSREFPHTRLRLIARTAKETTHLVRTNEADLGIIAEHRVPDDVDFLPLATYGAYVLMPRGHPLVRHGEPSIRDLLSEDVLNRYPLVMFAGDADHSPVREVLAGQGLPVNVALEVGTVDTLKYYVSQGHGLGVLSELCVTDDDIELRAIKIPNEFWPGTTYGVIHRPGKYHNAALTRLIDLLKNTGAEL